MTNKNEIATVVVNGITSLWKSYKQSNRARFETPGETFMRSLFGIEANDADAAVCLVKDVKEIAVKTATKRKFNKIVENSY